MQDSAARVDSSEICARTTKGMDAKMSTTQPKRGRQLTGRIKGAKAKPYHSVALKDMILAALHKNGGVEYLSRQAKENPVAFMSLLAKVIPLKVDTDGAPLTLQVVVNGGHIPDLPEDDREEKVINPLPREIN